ncbi:uncharacterized protein LOC119103090 [Pollicipes pollicipes]|uniref:uncharacterized protein LOC119103090 n=1 Tax=Pollicipes pollicipes TaxID=41117 RepID=UPI0018853FD9|nr:uncharacterized protein LOC119103090 [Pollicipes pollicipes]
MPEPATNSSLARSSRVKRQLVIPNGLTIGIIPRFDYTVFQNANGEQLVVSVDVEIDYTFPSSSASGKSGLNRISRLLYDKQTIYSGLETAFTRFGLNGRACTLRAICEVGETPDHQDGLLGDLLGYLLSASYGVGRRSELKEYYQAEYYGRKYGHCASAFHTCPISIFALVSADEADADGKDEEARDDDEK